MSRRITIPASAAVAGLLLVTGCLSTSSYHTARTLPDGETEIGLAMEVMGAVGEDDLITTQPRLNVRRGLGEALDVGLSAGSHGTRVDLNMMMASNEHFAASFNPTLTAAWFRAPGLWGQTETGSAFSVTPALLADYRLSQAVTWTVGLKPTLLVVPAADEIEMVMAGSIGARLGTDEFHVFPELNFMRVTGNERAPWMWTLGLGIGF